MHGTPTLVPVPSKTIEPRMSQDWVIDGDYRIFLCDMLDVPFDVSTGATV
jgi:hypothetical protein